MEGGDDDEGAEDLFAVDAHAVGDVCEDGRRDEEALSVRDVFVWLAAGEEGGALGFTRVDIGQNALVLLFRYLRALECGVMEGIADFTDGVDLFFEFFHEPIVDGVLDEDAGGSSTDLAHIRHDACVGPLDGLVEVGVFEDEEGGFAAGFEGDVFEVDSGHFHDLAACGCRASEGDFVDVEVGRDGCAGVFTVAVEDVDDAGGEAGFFDQGGEVEDAEGGLFGGFDNDRVAAGEGGA